MEINSHKFHPDINGYTKFSPTDLPKTVSAESASEFADHNSDDANFTDRGPNYVQDLLSDLRSWIEQVRSVLDRLSPSEEIEAAQRSQYESQNSTSLQIETKEGDIVTIDIQKYLQQDVAQFSYTNGSSSANGLALSYTHESSLQFRVEGDLNDEEKQNIYDLLQQIDQVATQFHGGDSDGALANAGNISIDNTALKAFTVNMHSEEHVRAIETYRQTAQASDEDSDSSPFAGIMQRMNELFKQLDEIFQFAETKTPFKNPHDAVRGLLDAVIKPHSEKTEGAQS